MQWNGIKIPVVLMALVVGLAAFWGSQWLYDRYNYERPLTKLLGENKDVASYSIDDRGPVLVVEVRLKKVDNLQQAYSGLNKDLQEIVGRRTFRIVIKDQRDDTLNGIYYHARLAAFEALERGNYLEMESYISRLAGREGSRARVWLDRESLYIQIDHGDSYLYEIIPRASLAGGSYPEGGERRNPS